MRIVPRIAEIFTAAALMLNPVSGEAHAHKSSATHSYAWSARHHRKGHSIIFLAGKMYEDTTTQAVIAQQQAMFPGSTIIPLPQQNAREFIADTIKKFARDGMLPLSRLVIDAHGAPNLISTAPLGQFQTSAIIDVHQLLAQMIAIKQTMLDQPGGKPTAGIMNEIVLQNCNVLANQTGASIAEYQEQARQLGARIIASATTVEATLSISGSLSKFTGEFFEFNPDGSIAPYNKYNLSPFDLAAARQDMVLQGLSDDGIICAANGGHNCFSAAKDAVTDALIHLTYAARSDQASAYVETLLENTPDADLSPQDAARAYLTVAIHTSDSSILARAMKGWKQEVSKIPPGHYEFSSALDAATGTPNYSTIWDAVYGLEYAVNAPQPPKNGFLRFLANLGL